MRTLFRNVEVEGSRCEVLLGDQAIEYVGEQAPRDVDDVIDGEGGALVPALHDHHLHLLASAAARLSVDCGAGLEALRGAPAGDWVRGVNAHESVDRHALDSIVADRPVRVQHRSGGLWMLNSRALELVDHVLTGPGVERGPDGTATGRLWRFDDRLREALPPARSEIGDALAAFVAELHSYGITSVTDATPDLDRETVSLLSGLPLGTTLLGDPDGTAPAKLLLHDHDLPALDVLAAQISAFHQRGRPVAVHCVSRESLLVTLAALDDIGRLPGDRIEHGGVVPAQVRERLRGLVVVTQPAMLAARAESYRRDAHPDDLDDLYPYASLLDAGVATLVSSDAPYGPVDPWGVLRAARDRDLAPRERVPVAVAAQGLFADAAGRRRRIAVGQPAAVCLLRIPWSAMCSEPDAAAARLVRDNRLPAPLSYGD